MAVLLVVFGPVLYNIKSAEAEGGAQIDPSGITISSKSDHGLFKITKAEVTGGTKKDTVQVTFKLDDLKDTSGKALSAMYLNSSSNRDTFYPAAKFSTGAYLDAVKAVAVDDIKQQCSYTFQGSSWDNCNFDQGVAIVDIADGTWKKTDSHTASLTLDYTKFDAIKKSAADANVKTTQTFDISVLPHFELAWDRDFTLTATANPLVKPLTIKVMLFVDDAARSADTTPDPGGEGNSTGQPNNTPLATLGNIINEAVTWFVLAATRIIYWQFAQVLAPLIESLLKIHPYQDIFVEAIFLGWQLVRNLCNIFFIVVLLVIGLGTLFRVESFSYKHLLVKVVIAALLVNFSLVFGQAILGVADTVQQQFLPDSQNVIRALGTKLMVDPINILTETAGTDTATAGASFGSIAKPVFAFTLALGAFLTFLAILAFLAIRIIALWVLLLASPLAYVANILPQTQSYSKEWWNKFLKYAFMTPVLAFFLNLSAVFVTTIISKENVSQFLVVKDVNNDVSQFVYLAGTQVLTILFLLVGLKAAASSGAYGAAAITTFAEKGMMKPLKWVGNTAQTLTKAGGERIFEGAQNIAGVTVDPRLLKKAWTDYSAEQHSKRLQARATRNFMGSAHGPKWGDAKSNFEAYANIRGVKRAVLDSKLGLRGAKYYTNQSKKNEARSKALTNDEVEKKKDRRAELEKSLINIEDDRKKADAATETLRVEIEGKQKMVDNGFVTGAKAADYLKEIAQNKEQLTQMQKSNEVLYGAEAKKDMEEELKKLNTELTKDVQNKAKYGMDDIANASPEEAKRLRQQALEQMNAADKQLSTVKRPEGYAALAAHHHLLSDEKKKIEHIDEADRLIQLYKDAVAQDDRYKAEAVMQKLAKDVNFNELLENLYGKNDYNTFVKHFTESFKKDFKVSDHDALEAMSEISYINEGNHMYNLSRAIEIDKHGHMKALSEADHNKIIAVQMKKVEPQGQSRQFWRGAFVDEELNDKDHYDPSKGKTFRLHDAGIEILRDSLSKGEGIKHVAGRMQEYNRKAILQAIEYELAHKDEFSKQHIAEVTKLANDQHFMDALKYGNPKHSDEQEEKAKKAKAKAKAEDEEEEDDSEMMD